MKYLTCKYAISVAGRVEYLLRYRSGARVELAFFSMSRGAVFDKALLTYKWFAGTVDEMQTQLAWHGCSPLNPGN